MRGACSVCSVEGVVRRGMCSMHYSRWRRGRPLDAPAQFRVLGDVATRLLAHSEDQPGPLATPCRVWTGALDSHGYGWFSPTHGKPRKAHRVAWEVFKGPLPADGTVPDHLCRVRRCINSEHLEWVTHQENIHRGVGPAATNRLKTHCPHGHPYDEVNTYVRPDGRGRECRACHGWKD